jgi:hypothetical protein
MKAPQNHWLASSTVEETKTDFSMFGRKAGWYKIYEQSSSEATAAVQRTMTLL